MRDRYASLREGLVGAWIPSISGSGLLLPDLSGQGNNGTLTNMGPEDWVAGEYGRALDFDGVNDFIAIPNYMLSEQKTVAFHAKWTTSLNTVVIGGNNQYYPYIESSYIYVRDSSGFTAVAHGGINLGRWYHFAIVGDGSVFSAYVDGIWKGSNTDKSPLVNAIAAYANGQFSHNGQLDDIRIYNRALSESEIKLLASRPGIGLRPQRRTMYYAPPTGARRRRILTSMP